MTTRAARSTHARLLAGVCTTAIMMIAMPGTAFAQGAATTDAPAGDQGDEAKKPDATQPDAQGEIVVTGIRASLRNSINIKRNEDSMVEAVSAEEIGKLPDQSIAESIARLPGLAAQRVGGRAQIISVRGFSPDFSTVLLNGRQQASSGYNRAVEFDQYPSELLSSVVVYKSPDANVSGMGLSGTVDLRTVRPLEYGKRAIALNLRGSLDQGGGRNSDMPKYGWRGSISYIDQNDDGTLGWSIGYAHLDQPTHTNHTKNWFYDNYGGPSYILSGQEVFASNARDIRDGVMGTLELKPSDSFRSTLDLYYSRFKQHTVMRGAQWFSDAYVDGVTYSDLQTRDIGGNNFAISGHVDNVTPILRFDDNRRTDNLFAIGWNNEWDIAERTKLVGDLSYSSNKRDETYIETYGGYGAGPFQTRTPDGYDFNIPADDFPQFSNFGLDYADANQVTLGDRAPWGGWGHDGLMKSPKIKERLTAVDLSLEQKFDGFLSSIDVGVNYTHRKKDKTVEELDLLLKNGRDQVPVDPRFLTDPTSLGFAGMGDILGVQIRDALDTYYDALVLQNADHYNKAWGITEDILTLKAKANIDSGDLHGNVGIQVVKQKQASEGLRINATIDPIGLADVKIKDSYTDILPSLNLAYDLTSQLKLRFAAAKVMARPRMDDMRANFVPGFNGSICAGSPPCVPGQEVHPWSASGGNPKLKPWRAKEVDVALEWYAGKATYFSVNAFYMFLDNYIYSQSLTADFSDFPLPDSASGIPAGVVISPIGVLSAPANGKGGNVRGVEVSGAFEFDRLTPLLSGFGVQGSVAYTKSKLNTEAVTVLGELPGLSKWVYNLTGYYEKNGFQARASYRYRSGFKGEVVSLFTNLDFTKILPDKQLDAQIGYTFPDGTRLGGLGVLLQVNNVLNSPYRTTLPTNGTQMLETYEEYGRQFLLGISKKF